MANDIPDWATDDVPPAISNTPDWARDDATPSVPSDNIPDWAKKTTMEKIMDWLPSPSLPHGMGTEGLIPPEAQKEANATIANAGKGLADIYQKGFEGSTQGAAQMEATSAGLFGIISPEQINKLQSQGLYPPSAPANATDWEKSVKYNPALQAAGNWTSASLGTLFAPVSSALGYGTEEARKGLVSAGVPQDYISKGGDILEGLVNLGGVAGIPETKELPSPKEPLVEPVIPENVEPQATLSPETPAPTYEPSYHFDTDTYGVKEAGTDNFIHTGLDNEEDAAALSDTMNKEPKATETPQPEQPVTTPIQEPVVPETPQAQSSPKVTEVSPSPEPTLPATIDKAIKEIDPKIYQQGQNLARQVNLLQTDLENLKQEHQAKAEAAAPQNDLLNTFQNRLEKAANDPNNQYVLVNNIQEHIGALQDAKEQYIADNVAKSTPEIEELKTHIEKMQGLQSQNNNALAYLASKVQEQYPHLRDDNYIPPKPEQPSAAPPDEHEEFPAWVTEPQAGETPLPSTPKNTVGEQTSIAGTEPISDRQLAERKMSQPMKANVTQQPANDGLFDMGARIPQEDLFKPQQKGVILPNENGRATNLRAFLNKNGAKFNEANELVSIKRGKETLKGQDALNYAHDISKEYGYLPKDAPNMPPRQVRELQDALTEKDGGRDVWRDADADKRAKEKEVTDAKKRQDPSYLEHEAYQVGIDTEGKTPKQILKALTDYWAGNNIIKNLWGDERGEVKSNVLKEVRDLIAPTMASENAHATAIAIRKAYGIAERERIKDETTLNSFAKQASKFNDAQISDSYQYIEGRSKGAELKDTSLQGMADAVRKVYGRMRERLEAMPETRMMNFVQDYFTHQWADPIAAKKFTNDFIAQQGSSRSLKKRVLPTIADGLAHGLELKEKNPIRAVSSYLGSMNNYIASVDALRDITSNLDGKYYAKGMQPEGFDALVGRNAERIENAKVDAASGKLTPSRNMQLYAPADVARIYNRFYSKGLEDIYGVKTVYEATRGAINANTLMELGLSTYHAGTIGFQAQFQSLSRLAKNIGTGDWVGAIQAAKKMTMPLSYYTQGVKGIEQYKGLANHGIDLEEIANHFAASNLRIGNDPLAQLTHHGFYKASQRGELPELLNHLKEQAKTGYGLGALKSGANVTARVVSDISAPIFDKLVPSVKFSAFGDLMGDWIRQNPSASDAEIGVARTRIGNMIEDRFGEMNNQNIFWNKILKQSLGLGIRAPGWDLGLIRQIGGPVKDIYGMMDNLARGKKFNPDLLDRPLFLVAGIATTVAVNSLMTWLKTGTPPSEQETKDFIAYRTGGMMKTFGKMFDERGELMGHAREMINMYPLPGQKQSALSGVEEEAKNKISSLPRNIYNAVTNKDWKNKDIYDPKSKDWVSRTPVLANLAYVAKGFEPFAMQNIIQDNPDSKLSFPERALGIRGAGARIVDRNDLGKLLDRKNK